MCDIGDNDFVECVQSNTSLLVKGRIYHVRQVVTSDDCTCKCHPNTLSFGLLFWDNPDPPPDTQKVWTAWCGLCFRPIYRPSEKLFELLMAPPKTERPGRKRHKIRFPWQRKTEPA